MQNPKTVSVYALRPFNGQCISSNWEFDTLSWWRTWGLICFWGTSCWIKPELLSGQVWPYTFTVSTAWLYKSSLLKSTKCISTKQQTMYILIRNYFMKSVTVYILGCWSLIPWPKNLIFHLNYNYHSHCTFISFIKHIPLHSLIITSHQNLPHSRAFLLSPTFLFIFNYIYSQHFFLKTCLLFGCSFNVYKEVGDVQQVCQHV
jgi:hypothetical protein